MNRKELFMKKRKIATILLAACLLLGNVSVANAASIDNGNKVHFNTEDNDTDLTLLQSKIATEEVTCDFTDATIVMYAMYFMPDTANMLPIILLLFFSFS